MKKILLTAALLPLLGAGCSVPEIDLSSLPTFSGTPERIENPQIGFNFIRFYANDDEGPAGAKKKVRTLNTSTPFVQPEAIFTDFDTLGVQAYRQFQQADLMWETIEPQNDKWNFTAPDAVLLNSQSESVPIVTLFRLQYASPTAPWITSPSGFQKSLSDDAKDYLSTVIDRYGASVKYWEIGNEMDHWRAADPGSTRGKETLPASYPLDGFSPQEQGTFFKEVAAFIRERDDDAVIVMPGMGSIADETVKSWLGGVLETAGPDTFDIVNYHFYAEDWRTYAALRESFGTYLAANGLSDIPVWFTETGSTWSEDTARVRKQKSPASEEEQAADIFRRLIPAYGHGDSLTMWHTYIGSPVLAGNEWGGFGIIDDKGNKMRSYYSYKLLTDELIPFTKAETLSDDPRGVNAYAFTVDGSKKYAAWGSGSYTAPTGTTQYASVVADAQGNFTWKDVSGPITLSSIPILIR